MNGRTCRYCGSYIDAEDWCALCHRHECLLHGSKVRRSRSPGIARLRAERGSGGKRGGSGWFFVTRPCRGTLALPL